MVLWGFITKYLISVTAAKVDFVPALLGAVLLWDFLVRVMQGVTMSFFEDVWSRNFLNNYSTPQLISEYLAGLVLSSIATIKNKHKKKQNHTTNNNKHTKNTNNLMIA